MPAAVCWILLHWILLPAMPVCADALCCQVVQVVLDMGLLMHAAGLVVHQVGSPKWLPVVKLPWWVFVEAPVLGVCLLVCGNVFVRLVFLAHVHIGETAVAG